MPASTGWIPPSGMQMTTRSWIRPRLAGFDALDDVKAAFKKRYELVKKAR